MQICIKDKASDISAQSHIFTMQASVIGKGLGNRLCPYISKRIIVGDVHNAKT